MADPFNAGKYAEDQAIDLSSLSYINQGAKRNLEVKPELVEAIRESVTAVYGPDYRVEVMSGAQGKGSRGVVGSRRHTTEAAADIWVRSPDGKKLTGDELVPLSQHWLATNTGSVGFPAKAGQSLHLDLIGGTGPGSVPRKKGESALWYYGTPTKSQREALGSSLTKGTTPKYAVSPETVSRGLIPPGSIPGVSRLKAPVPAQMSDALWALQVLGPEKPVRKIAWVTGKGNVYVDTGEPVHPSTERASEPTVAAYTPDTSTPTVNDPFLATALAAMSGKKRTDMSRIPGSPFFDKGLPGNVSGSTKLSEEEWAQLNAADPTVSGLGSLTGNRPFPMVPGLPKTNVADLYAGILGPARGGVAERAQAAPPLPPSFQVAGLGAAGLGVNGGVSGSATIPPASIPSAYDSPRTSRQVADLYAGILPGTPRPQAAPARPSMFPARPSVIAPNTSTAASGRTIAQIGQEADNARLSGYRQVQEMGPSSKGAPVRLPPPTPKIPGEYLGGAGGAGIAGQVQLPHDVRPNVTIPKLPATPSVPQFIPQTVRVPNPAWTAPSGMAVNSSGQAMSRSALDAIRGVPANSYQKPPRALSANMRGTNRTPGMAQYLTKTQMVPNPAYVAPPLPRPRPPQGGLMPVPQRPAGLTVIDQLRAQGMTQSQAYAAAAASAHRPTNAAERAQARQDAAESEARALNNFMG